MKKFAVLIVALGTLPLASIQASATKLTQQQVKTVCGSKFDSATVGSTTRSGCDKKCGSHGEHTCSFNCCSGPGCIQEGCDGSILWIKAGDKKIKGKLPAATLIEIKRMTASPARPPSAGLLDAGTGLGRNGPAAAGSAAPSTPTGPVLK